MANENVENVESMGIESMGIESMGQGMERAPDGEPRPPAIRAALRAVVASPRFATVAGLLCIVEAIFFCVISALAHVAQPMGLLVLLLIVGTSSLAAAMRPTARRSPAR
jgi:hypothetical protein